MSFNHKLIQQVKQAAAKFAGDKDVNGFPVNIPTGPAPGFFNSKSPSKNNVIAPKPKALKPTAPKPTAPKPPEYTSADKQIQATRRSNALDKGKLIPGITSRGESGAKSYLDYDADMARNYGKEMASRKPE